jgi:hypothetical protein
LSQSSPEPHEVAKIDLSHGSLHTVKVGDQPHIVLKSAIDDLGLDYSTQLRKLKGRSWTCMGQSPMQMPGDDQMRTVTTVSVETFLMLLATVNENKVAESIRPVLVAFQSETARAIADYWTKGSAKNLRLVDRAGVRPTTVSWDQAAAIARLQYRLDVDTNELRELLNKGGILKNTLSPHKKWEHLFWPLATRWEIHASVLPQLINFAAKIRRELAVAEQDLQMSLPFPIASIVRNELGGDAA